MIVLTSHPCEIRERSVQYHWPSVGDQKAFGFQIFPLHVYLRLLLLDDLVNSCHVQLLT